mgnify:CR=1 FL=1
MVILYITTAVILLISVIFDPKKTLKGIKNGWKKFHKILPRYLRILIFIAIILYFSEELIITYLQQDNSILGLLAGMLLGSISMMPGFIAYPLSGLLLEQGVLLMIIAGFVTTLMMVGIVTFPLEKAYMGTKAAVLRNFASFFIALLIALAMGFLYGELHI